MVSDDSVDFRPKRVRQTGPYGAADDCACVTDIKPKTEVAPSRSANDGARAECNALGHVHPGRASNRPLALAVLRGIPNQRPDSVRAWVEVGGMDRNRNALLVTNDGRKQRPRLQARGPARRSSAP